MKVLHCQSLDLFSPFTHIQPFHSYLLLTSSATFTQVPQQVKVYMKFQYHYNWPIFL